MFSKIFSRRKRDSGEGGPNPSSSNSATHRLPGGHHHHQQGRSTLWDHLVAVFEVVHPERIIDAAKFITKMREKNRSQVSLFHRLLVEYQHMPQGSSNDCSSPPSDATFAMHQSDDDTDYSASVEGGSASRTESPQSARGNRCSAAAGGGLYPSSFNPKLDIILRYLSFYAEALEILGWLEKTVGVQPDSLVGCAKWRSDRVLDVLRDGIILRSLVPPAPPPPVGGTPASTTLQGAGGAVVASPTGQPRLHRDPVAAVASTGAPLNTIANNAGARYFAARENIILFMNMCKAYLEWPLCSSMFTPEDLLGGDCDERIVYELQCVAVQMYCKRLLRAPLTNSVPPHCAFMKCNIAYPHELMHLQEAVELECSVVISQLPRQSLLRVTMRDMRLLLSHEVEHPTELGFPCTSLQGMAVALRYGQWVPLWVVVAQFTWQWDRLRYLYVDHQQQVCPPSPQPPGGIDDSSRVSFPGPSTPPEYSGLPMPPVAQAARSHPLEPAGEDVQRQPTTNNTSGGVSRANATISSTALYNQLSGTDHQVYSGDMTTTGGEGDGHHHTAHQSSDSLQTAPSIPMPGGGDASLGNSIVYRREISNFSATLVYETPEKQLEIAEHTFCISSHRRARIGSGAFGYVFRALDVHSGATVAVKVSRGLNDAQRAALLAEVKLMAALPKHPNVIGFLGLSVKDESNQVHLVMEYAPCGSVAELYHMHPKLPHRLTLHHIKHIAKGLKHLHDFAIVHRDLKPENILTRADGSVAIADFGCSLVTNDMTNGIPVGTVAYLSPEAADRCEYTPKSDVWAFACTMVVLLTGQLPWSTVVAGQVPTMFHIAQRSLDDCEPFPMEVLRALPYWAEPLVLNCFLFRPEDRWNMADVTTYLEQVPLQ